MLRASRMGRLSANWGACAMRKVRFGDARANLAAVVDEAIAGMPVVITRHGKRQVVVVSYEEWQRLSQVPCFGRLLMAAPLKAGDLPARKRVSPRKSDF